MNLPIAVIGFGGHGRVVAAALVAAGEQVIAATDLAPEACRARHSAIEVVTDQTLLDRYQAHEIRLALGIGSVWPCDSQCLRQRTANFFQELGYQFVGFRHPSAWVAPDTVVAANAQIHAGVIIQPGVVVADFAIINTGATIDHDSRVEKFCHIGPGVTVSGNTKIGSGSHLGTGCNIIQGIRIGECSFVAAGATVVRDVGDREFVRGTPARQFQPSQHFTNR